MEQQVPALCATPERRLAHAPLPADATGAGFLATLDRLITASENRFPVPLDLARGLRHRYFEETLFEGAHQTISIEMESHPACLGENPDAPDRGERIHTVQRALAVGSLDRFIPASTPRGLHPGPYG